MLRCAFSWADFPSGVCGPDSIVPTIF
uniref:Uncharacterized protein n=1 Tax=Anguilla anguilla TaxID=7936 RepID=A0A0E9QPW4_ANGAN